MGTSSKALLKRLQSLATRQGGYFTARQAIRIGYADSIHGYHVRNGDWLKAGRGIYRLSSHPGTKWPFLHVAQLWSRGRDDSPQGAFSHQTALAIQGLEPMDEGRSHLTVPRNFRRNTSPPDGVVLHKGDIPEADVVEIDGLRVLRSRNKDLCTKPKTLPMERGRSHPAGASSKNAGHRSWSGGRTLDEVLRDGED